MGDKGELTHVVVEYHDKPAGEEDPIERVTIPASDKERYATSDGVGHIWEHVSEGVEKHVKGECDCV